MKQPIYLFSDSQLLFWDHGDRSFAHRLVSLHKETAAIKAAYIGASNGDLPEYFEIFRAAMERIDVNHPRMIKSDPKTAELDFLIQADLVLLAGGDVKQGWEVMQSNGVAGIIKGKYAEGATLIGISAGAIQLSLMGFEDQKPFETLKLVPFIIDVHDEADDWWRLKQNHSLFPNLKAYGIPFGGGMTYHPDGRVEALRNELFKIN